MQNRFKWHTSPVALPENTVCGKNYRFTVLTNRLIRLEYSLCGIFEDRASQSFFYRDLPAVNFESKINDGVLTINTGMLELNYKTEEPFSRDTLTLKLLTEPASCWQFGDEFETLGGTSQTLDVISGEIPLADGLVSMRGFSVVDDSNTFLLGDDGWIEVRNKGNLDFYFFGYGYEYNDCIKDFYRLSGMPTMLPAYALGNWWSRYYDYTDESYLALMSKFRSLDIPFSVGIIDMDWHKTAIPKELEEKLSDKDTYEKDTTGWTGYSWNKELFPDYKRFLKALHSEYHIKTALNLHPAAGVLPHEDMYGEMCEKMGRDPKEMRRIPFDVLSPEFMANYFDVLHHPYEENGVDFWWMDWQQGVDYKWIHTANKNGEYADPRERLNPLWMLNHLHNADIMRNGKRPMFFSRYSGLGSQRYAIGFSGDTAITWESLKFQPEFTASAANVGYGQWSHDIGGHTAGYCDEDLYLRWLQFGVLSPINRLHSSKHEFIKREPWRFTKSTEETAKRWLRLRHRLFPYIYTMNYRAATEGEQLIKPLYYAHPKKLDAYKYPNQYFFGSELMVVPITSPNSKVTGTGSVDAWLPQGDWFDLFDGRHYLCEKDRRMTLSRDSERIPVLAKGGAIVPLYEYEPKDNELKPQMKMTVLVFPAADGTFSLYEDGGDGDEYKKGKFAMTDFNLKFGKTTHFTISPAAGDTSLIPEQRKYNIAFRGVNTDIAVTLSVNGIITEAKLEKQPETNTVFVRFTAAVKDSVEITLDGEETVTDNGNVDEIITHLFDIAQMRHDLKSELRNGNLNNKKISVHDRIFTLANQSHEYKPLYDAVKELLTLTKEEFYYPDKNEASLRW